MAKLKDRLREALRESGMKAIDLAEIIGVDRGSISHWMSGRYEPSPSKRKRIADALNVNEAWLCGFDVEKEKPDPVLVEKRSETLEEEMRRRMLKHISEIYGKMPFDVQVDIYEAVRKIEAEEEERHGSKEA